ncbi:ketopantoate reductase family protein [Halobaculum magnesiiphilum]|uniref:2-dehydropantoate 2-reductase n=1 Tax=Halobaculum magnesiiphilum TaxID=1017351 RepID=A0A8T8WA02_9EURY|nr:2-dehydropantoate 2-reductase [Halobaculum magnesiiphilum]QZP36594.1 2-dehydropantoate 2-reductase [Halobaculum magnesiiphilum]
MDIVVFGAGALGSLVGGLLAREHQVTLVARDPHARRVAGQGLRVVGELDAHTRPRATTDPTPEDLTCDLALVTVKAYDTEVAAEALAAGDPDLVCSLSNGLCEETLAEHLGDRVLAGSVTYGAELVGPGEVRCTGVGRIHVGEFAADRLDSDEGDAASDRADRVAAAFRECGLDCTADPAMPRRRWEKLAVNAGINAVTALARVPNGALADGPGRDVAHRAARETARVARAEGVDLPDERAVDAVDTVVAETAANRSSMRQDVESGNRTEVDAITGTVVDRGRDRGVDTPTNRTMADLLRTWERNRIGE